MFLKLLLIFLLILFIEMSETKKNISYKLKKNIRVLF